MISVIFVATDNGEPVMSDTDTVTIIVSVTQVNHAPQWNLKSIQRSIKPGSMFSYNLGSNCSDPDNDKISFSLTSALPAKDTIIGATYSFTPTAADTGKYTIHILASDSSGLTDTLILGLVVTVTNIPDSIPPVIKFISPSKDTVISADSFEVKVTCIDDSGCAVKGYRDGTTFTLKKSVTVSHLWTGMVKGIASGNYSIIKIVAIDSSAAKNRDSVSIKIKYDNDRSGPVITLITPIKDSVTTNTSNYAAVLKVTDPSGVISVTGVSSETTYTGIRDTGSLWKININTLEANKTTIIVLTATDSSLKANKAVDTLYIQSEIVNGFIIKFDKNDSAATGAMVDQTINSGDSAKLSANAFIKEGSTFAGWMKNPTDTTIAYTDSAMFKMGTSGVTLYAKWAKKTAFTLAIIATNGSVTKSPAFAVYDSGTVVTLTPVPSESYHFSGWSGALSDTTNPGTIIMNSNKSVTAGFEINPPNTFTLTVAASNGTVKKTPDLPQYDSGSTVGLKAIANTGYRFVNWNGDVTGTTDSASLVINKGKNVTANFAIKNYTLTVASTNGSVTKLPNAASYDSGTVVTITATPVAGYQFAGWSGDLSGGTNPESITMNSVKSVIANFIIKTYALSITATNGNVTKSPNAAKYDSGTVVSLTATPAVGYQFTGWSGGLTGTANPALITMNAEKNIAAIFAIKKYSISITSLNGSVIKTPNSPTYDSGSIVGLKAKPNNGYIFSNWSGDLTGINDSTNILMTGSKNITANFGKIPCAQTLTNDGHGTTTPAAGTSNVSYGDSISISATAGTGYKFASWSITPANTATVISPTSAITKVVLTSAATITANFQLNTYNLSIIINGNGTTTPTGVTTVNHGVSTSITAVPNTGSKFAKWVVTSGVVNIANDTSASTTVTLTTGNATVIANFGTVLDIDRNVYTTVVIGNQEWTIQNLRVTHYNDGTAIPNITDNTVWGNLTSGAYCYYNNSTNPATWEKWGALYNWYAANTGKLAPEGWRIPTDADWTILENYLIASGYNYDGSPSENKIAKALAAQSDWTTDMNAGTPGNDLSKNNSSGFTALPGGYRDFQGIFGDQNRMVKWWSGTGDATYAGYRGLQVGYEGFVTNINLVQNGFYIRLVRDFN